MRIGLQLPRNQNCTQDDNKHDEVLENALAEASNLWPPGTGKEGVKEARNHMAEQRKAEMEAKIKHLETDKKDLERQVQELINRCDATEKREQERRALDEKKHAEEVEFFKKTNDQLKSNLESLLSTPKKS